MATVQRDLFVELDERLLIRDNPSLQIIASALPELPILKPYHLLAVLPISEKTIYSWIKAKEFLYVNLSAGNERQHYGIFRTSFLEFLARRVAKGNS